MIVYVIPCQRSVTVRVFHLFLYCSVTHCDINSSQHKTVFNGQKFAKKDELGFAVRQCTRSVFVVVKEHVASQNQDVAYFYESNESMSLGQIHFTL